MLKSITGYNENKGRDGGVIDRIKLNDQIIEGE